MRLLIDHLLLIKRAVGDAETLIEGLMLRQLSDYSIEERKDMVCYLANLYDLEAELSRILDN